MAKSYWTVVPALFALALTGCGGGGGGSGPAEAPATVLKITSDNAKPVAADALQNATGTQAVATGASLVTGVQVDTDNNAQGSTTQLAAAARTLASLIPARAPLATGVAINDTVPCSGGGTLNISGNVSDGSALVAGDNMTLSASNCKETVDGVLTTMSGSMRLQINSSTLTSTIVYPYRIVMSITASNFSVTVGGVTNSSDGDLTMDLTANSATSEVLVLSGTSMSSITRDSRGTRGGALKNYKQTVTVQGTTESTNIVASIESTNARLGAGTVKYDVSTPTPLVTSSASGAYTSGSMKIVGANSAILVTVTGSNTFSVQLDANGDGTYESKISTTLTELNSLL